LVVWLVLRAVVGVAVAGLGMGSCGSGVSHPNASVRCGSARRGLTRLPLAARGPVSGVLGGADRSYAVRGGPTGLSAVSGAQGLRLGFGRSGVVVRSGSSRLSLGLAAIGYGNRLRAVAPVAPSYRGNRVWYARGPVQEWYANGPLGLEQGFTVPRRLSGGGVALTLSLAE